MPLTDNLTSPLPLPSGREIRLLNQFETRHPLLQRLCQDFDFRVVELFNPYTPTAKREFVLVTADDIMHNTIELTARFHQLNQLERHIKEHLIEILSQYFGQFTQDDTATPNLSDYAAAC